MKTEDKIAKGDTYITTQHSFFGMAANAMPVEVVDDPSITAWTDGTKRVYGRQFVDSLTLKQTVGLTIHEVLHPFLQHIKRMARQFEACSNTANTAADYEINNYVTLYNQTASIPIVLPPQALVDLEEHGTEAAEVIFKKIYKKEKGGGGGRGDKPCDKPDKGTGQGGGQGNKPSDKKPDKDGKGGGSQQGEQPQGPSSPGEFRPPKEKSKLQEVARKWTEILTSSIQVAKLRGKGGGKFMEALEKILEPPLDIESLLEPYISEFCVAAEDPTRMDKRMVVYYDLCVRGIEGERHGTIVYVKDTSGSMDRETLESVMGVVQTISDRLNPDRIIVIDVDAKVQHVEEFTPGEDIPIEAKGRGGTDFRPAFDFIENNLEEARVIIYATDGYGPFPEEEPDTPTLWLSWGKDEDAYPFGQVVDIKQLIAQARK